MMHGIFSYIFFGWLHPQLLNLHVQKTPSPTNPAKPNSKPAVRNACSPPPRPRKWRFWGKSHLSKVGEILLVWPIPSMGLMYSPTVHLVDFHKWAKFSPMISNGFSANSLGRNEVFLPSLKLTACLHLKDMVTFRDKRAFFQGHFGWF